MKYRIISVGKIKEKFFLQGIEEYLKRLRPYTSIELVDGLEEKTNPHAGPKDIDRILQKEGLKILNIIGSSDIIVVLDSRGKSITSEELAQKIEAWNSSGKTRVNLIVGGSHGLSEEIKQKADETISFSRMTFVHQMVVLILSEQIYRGYKILRGEPYHK